VEIVGREIDMWIFCCGMKRSGSTLQYQLVAHLVEDAKCGVRVGWSEYFTDVYNQHYTDTRWKVYKNHNFSPEIAAEFDKGNAKGLYIYRDLRDVFVSFMHKQDVPFERLWKRDILKDLIEHYDQWVQLPNMLISRYETVMQDVSGEVKRIADHLELPLTLEKAQEIANQYSVEKQLDRIKNAADEQRVNDKAVFDKHSLLHENHISENQGQVGQWQTLLIPDEIALIEDKYGYWLIQHGYSLQTR
jgi:hypothetical protein